MQESAWTHQRGGGRRVDGMRDKRASIDGRPTEEVWNDGYQSVDYKRQSMDGKTYNVANTSHGNLAALDAEDTASEAQAMKPLPRRPVGLTGNKPSRSESTNLGEVFPSAPATSGREQTSVPSAARPQDQVATENEHHGVGVDYTPTSYFASRSASRVLDSRTDGINRQSSHLDLQGLENGSK